MKILVIGSANIDLVVNAPHIPTPGETVLGSEFAIIPGGKGANQAAAAARLGADVAFLACVGRDTFAQTLLDALQKAGVDPQHVRTIDATPTGVALITVSAAGENAITVAPGANASLTPADIEAAAPLFASAAACVLQLEIPLETALAAIRVARRHALPVILDPAPAPADAPPELFHVDILTPNASEAQILIAQPLPESLRDVGKHFHARGANCVVLKRGPAGAAILAGDTITPVAAPTVTPIDTTAAGDAFTAALAVAVAEGQPLPEATRFACAAGAAACTRRGAQPSLPTRDAVLALLAAPTP